MTNYIFKTSYSRIILFIFIFSTLLLKSNTSEAGIRVLISEKGLNYAGSIAVDLLSSELLDKPLDGNSGTKDTSIGKVEYEIKNIKITNFVKPSSRVMLNSGVGITWSLSNAQISCRGDWKYKYKKGFIKLSDHGSLSIEASDITISVLTEVKGLNGRLTISSQDCSAHVSNLKIDVSGGAGWLYNLLIDVLKDPLKDSIKQLLCREAVKAINNDANKELSNMDIDAKIDDKINLDFKIISDPVFTPNNLEAYMAGQFYVSDGRPRRPLPLSMMIFGEDSKMLSFLISESFFDSGSQALYDSDQLKFLVNKDSLSDENKHLLDTNCKGFLCVIGMLQKVAETFPNSTLELDLHILQIPKLIIKPNGLTSNVSLTVNFSVKSLNSDSIGNVDVSIIEGLPVTPHGGLKLFSANFNILVNLTLKVENNLLKLTFGKITTKIGPIQRFFSQLNDKGIEFSIKFAVKSAINELNKKGKKGLPIPRLGEVSLENPTIFLKEGFIDISTDIKHIP